MAGYVYKGKQPLVPAENVPPAPIVRYARKPFLAELCGSLRGYNQHRRYENPPCRGCMDAHNTSRRERHAARLAANQNAHNHNKIRRGIVRETPHSTAKIVGYSKAPGATNTTGPLTDPSDQTRKEG